MCKIKINSRLIIKNNFNNYQNIQKINTINNLTISKIYKYKIHYLFNYLINI